MAETGENSRRSRDAFFRGIARFWAGETAAAVAADFEQRRGVPSKVAERLEVNTGNVTRWLAPERPDPDHFPRLMAMMTTAHRWWTDLPREERFWGDARQRAVHLFGVIEAAATLRGLSKSAIDRLHAGFRAEVPNALRLLNADWLAARVIGGSRREVVRAELAAATGLSMEEIERLDREWVDALVSLLQLCEWTDQWPTLSI